MQNDIVLYENQVSNYNRIKEILTYSKFAFNLSELGSGKSIIGIKIGEDYDNVIVVSYPAVINQNWSGLISKYGIKNMQTITINTLRGRKNFNTNNTFILRHDYPERKTKKVVFEATDFWKDMCNNSKTLLIIDEFQMNKNKNIGTVAVKELIRVINASKYSRVLLMSGTPVDNVEQIMNYFKLLGVVKNSNKFNNLKALYLDETIDEDINCFNFDIKLVNYFKNYFLPKYSDKMLPSIRKIHGFINYYTLENSDEEIIKHELDSLAVICDKMEKNGKIEAGDTITIKHHLQNIEMAKIKILSEIIKKYLAETNKKIVVALFYIKPILALSKLLYDYNPKIIIGDTSNTDRNTYINQFQEPNNTHRLLICNADIIGVGINLDDTHGGFPRVCFLSSNYKSMISHQLFYRFSRVTTKSIPEIRIIFSKGSNEERVMQILNSKTKIMKDFSTSSYYLNDFVLEEI